MYDPYVAVRSWAARSRIPARHNQDGFSAVPLRDHALFDKHSYILVFANHNSPWPTVPNLENDGLVTINPGAGKMRR